MSEQYRPIDEQYDTMMDVQENPTGAWMAIQSLHDTVIEQQAEIERLRAEGQFLLDRLNSFAADNLNDETARDWWGHVEPSIERMQLLLGASQ